MSSADARTLHFLRLLKGLAHGCGLDPERLAKTEAEALAEHLTVAAENAWRDYDWPDTTPTEQRALRPIFGLGETYLLGDEVYDVETDHYYRALQDGFAGRAVTDGAYWEEVTCLTKNLPLLSLGDTPMAEVLGVWDADPATDTGAQPLGYYLTDGDVQFEPDCPNTVWVRFRIPPPRFTAAVWKSTTIYLPGDLVFVTPHCYMALEDALGSEQSPENDPDRWRKQELPELLERAVKRLAKAEWLEAEGQDDKAAIVQGRAEAALADASETLSTQQGQGRRYSVATRTRASRLYRPRRLAV